MGRLIRGFSRFWRAVVSVITLQFIKGAKKIEEDSDIVGMEYDDIIRADKIRARKITEAVGGLIAQQEQCITKAERISKNIGEFVEERDGALALAQERMKALKVNGKTDDEVLQDGEVRQYQSAYTDAASTIVEKEARIKDFEIRAENLQVSIDEYVVQAQEVTRRADKMSSEKYEAMASIEASQQLKEINELVAGISVSGTGERLARVRQITAEAEGKAKAAARVAGTDQKFQRAKLRAAAKRHVQNKDFLAGMGIKTETATPAKPAASKEAPKAKVDKTPELTE